MSIFYGPVLSRRFGYSLGVDIIPYKICSYDCTYCQLGKTTTKTINRKSYVKINLEEFKYSLCSIIDKNERIDYITFSGSGEPTLNKNIGTLIKQVKSITDIPVAVLTNGSLLNKKGVIDDIKKADLIKVSMDAPDQKYLQKINRPHPDIKFASLSEGLNLLLNTFKGKVWLEIMLIKGINDSLETAYEFEAFLKNLQDISPGLSIEKIHLNTPVRPPGSRKVFVPDYDRLLEIKKILGKKAELIKELDIEITGNKDKSLTNNIIELARRRPVTSRDISKSLMVNTNEVIKCLKPLLEQEKIKFKVHNNERFYCK